jgi:amino acid transporter
MPSIFRFSYWFALTPLPFTHISNWLMLIVMLVFLVAGIVGLIYVPRVKDKDWRRAWRRSSHVSLWAGICGLLLYTMRWQRVPLLSMRLWYIGWVALFGWLIWTIVRLVKIEIPFLKTESAKREAYEKWLPKPKK